jgi:beta-N-acetylhexosaminidase
MHLGRTTLEKSGRAGQLLIIGFEGAEISPRLRSLLGRIRPAGIILFARNIATGAQTAELLRECQRSFSAPLFLCVDMEGGKVDRLRNVIGSAPAPADVFAAGDRKLFRKHGTVIGECCRVLGFNTDFAPCLDLAFPPSRSVMSSRAVSADASETAVYAREFLRGLRQAGVLGAGKHFPGLGEAKLDSHHELPVIEKSWRNLWAQDLYPYRTLCSNLPFVMVSHAAYPAVTRDRRPASLSKQWVADILRKKIGYRGLVISDDLEMGAVQAVLPTEQAAVEHIRAGGDIALICHQQELIERAHEALIKEAESDRKFWQRVVESARHVESQKKKLLASIRWRVPSRSFPPPSAAKLEHFSRQLWEFSERVRLETIGRQERA